MAALAQSIISSSYTVSVTVIQKVSANNHEQLQISCNASDTVQSFRDKIHDNLNKSPSEYRISIAYKGKILQDNASSLQSNDIIPNQHRPVPKVYVTMKKLTPRVIKSRATRQTENAANAERDEVKTQTRPEMKDADSWQIVDPPANNNNNVRTFVTNENEPLSIPNAANIEDIQYQNLTGNEDDHKQCRLCFSSEEDNVQLGQLFQPCRCSGTMKWIHVRCLNEWRAVAPNSRSYYRCDQCHFEYNLRRAQWADIVAHPNTAKALSVVILLIGIILFGITTFKLPIASYIYSYIEWDPFFFFSTKSCPIPKAYQEFGDGCTYNCNSMMPWNDCMPQCHQVCGWDNGRNVELSEWSRFYIEVFFSGVFVLSLLGLYAQRRLLWRHKLIFLMTLAQSTRIWRLFILVGVGHSFYGLLQATRIVVKKFLFEFGERILNVDMSS